MRALLVGQLAIDRVHPSRPSRLVYRILFLLFAKVRALVPMWHPIYRGSSLEALREAAERSPMFTGLWDALRAVSRMAHAGCCTGDLRVTAFNGRLFAASRTPLAGAPISTVMRSAGRSCRWARGRLRIARAANGYWSGDLGVEQLGAVYEALLDYEPRVEGIGGAVRVKLERGCTLKDNQIVYTPSRSPTIWSGAPSRRSQSPISTLLPYGVMA